jgi:hypothetical protein
MFERSLEELWADREYGPRRFGRWPCRCFDFVPSGGPSFPSMPVRRWNSAEIDECPGCHIFNPDR